MIKRTNLDKLPCQKQNVLLIDLSFEQTVEKSKIIKSIQERERILVTYTQGDVTKKN